MRKKNKNYHRMKKKKNRRRRYDMIGRAGKGRLIEYSIDRSER